MNGVRTNLTLAVAALAFFLLAAWGLHQMFADLLNPILKALGGS